HVTGVQTCALPISDGPKLAPIALAVPVMAKPKQDAEKIGYLRVGARVARSEEPVSTENCPAGWYKVRPLGYVCADTDSTTDEAHPLVRAIDTEPDRSKPMPYAYGFLRAVAPNYLRVPGKKLQHEREMRLERHLHNWKKLSTEWDKLDVGANDVLLDERGLGLGEIPAEA